MGFRRHPTSAMPSHRCGNSHCCGNPVLSIHCSSSILVIAITVVATAALSCDEMVSTLAKDRKALPGPTDANRRAWFQSINALRAACRINQSTAFDDPSLSWSQTSYVQAQMHPWDELFYNLSQHRYTPDVFLDDLERRYGGVDSVLLWPTYPQLGLDNRNMFDLFRALPGGLSAVRAAVLRCKKRGVRVLLPYTPWDVNYSCTSCGTNRTEHPHDPQLDVFALLDAVGADGINADTVNYLPEQFYRHGVAIEPEFLGTAAMRSYHTMGWGYWKWDKGDADAPMVDLWKIGYDSRFMTHGCERWVKDHTRFIQMAFFNAVGFVGSCFCVMIG